MSQLRASDESSVMPHLLGYINLIIRGTAGSFLSALVHLGVAGRLLELNSCRSDAQVGRVMLAFSASGLDMRICELLLLRIDS